MFNGRGYEKRKTKAELGKPSNEFLTLTGVLKLNPVVEAGALIADYADKDDEVTALWFKPYGGNHCAAVVEFDGNNGMRIAKNIVTLIQNSYPEVVLKLYSTRSDTGKEIASKARQLYRKKEKSKTKEMEA